jgi:outer membrane lipoprotein SlyB
MNAISILAAAGLLMLVGNTAAEAKGCIKGALVGGVAGHFMHRHTLLGAAAGCVIGHHMAHKKEQQEKAAAAARAHQQQQQQPAH